MIIDTHCHIDLYKNPKEVLKECEKAGITVLAMTNLPSHFAMGYTHVLPYKKIRLALGMHPLYAKYHNQEFPCFLKNFSKTSYIGEIGLDFSREGYGTKNIQLTTFTKILDHVAGQKKLISIHSRRAEKEVLNLLIEKNIRAAIFHWYSGPLSLIEKIVNAGYFFSINSSMADSENGIKIISRIPTDKILTETDGPFIRYENREVHPKDIQSIIEKISKIKNFTKQNLSQTIENNFTRLIGKIK